MKDVSSLPNMDIATANLDRGEMKDDVTPGDGAGTPVRKDWQQDEYYGLRAILNLAGKTPDDSEEGVVTSQVADAIRQLIAPIGAYDQWDKSFPNAPALDPWWVECDGSLISDADSPFNGYRTRNLNGGNVVLSLSWTAGTGPNGGSVTTAAVTNLTALAVGDDVSGTGIAAGSTVTDITGTTVEISDPVVSGSISSTFTNRGRFARGALASGVGENDAMQRITGEITTDTNLVANAGVFDTPTTSGDGGTSGPGGPNVLIFDSSLSTSPNAAKTDDTETRPLNTSVVYIFKIK